MLSTRRISLFLRCLPLIRLLSLSLSGNYPFFTKRYSLSCLFLYT
nr:MAG TPA: hypothetical protein [Caudoviricetes sp.]